MKLTNTKRRRSRRKNKRHLSSLGEQESLVRAQRLFESGHELDLLGRSDSAEAVYRHTIELLEDLSEQSVSISEIAKIAQGHGEELFRMGRYSKARLAFERSRELLDSLIILDASHGTIYSLTQTLSWLARSQRKTGRGKESCRTYERCISLLRTLSNFPQSRSDLEAIEHRLATSLFGYSKILRQHGQKQKAKRCKDEAIEICGYYLSRAS